MDTKAHRLATSKDFVKRFLNGYMLLPFGVNLRRMTPLERDHSRGLNGALAAEIRAELGARRISVRALAAMADIDRLTLRRYVNAERALNTAHVEAIAEALEMDPGELMARAVARRDEDPDQVGPGGNVVPIRPVSDPPPSVPESGVALDGEQDAGTSEFDD